MSSAHRLLILLLLAVGLVGCDKVRKSDSPATAVAITPKPVVIVKRIYVPIPPEMTRPEPVAEGPIAQCFDVAAQRRAALERANAKLSKAAAIQGTEVKP
ncbi:hypothetical protein NB688_000582 [Xanthomonas sacchari]|uniref:Lipoprotein n=1 Tax=Xanthomonas sacchari TaxID=56458 RepID=A0ABT3DTH0_9XANT|nr:hypothetical protein [Xanthomonas sacchari]MCW0398768.1 hypothetical protein [Xanthomonas sacchari]MCW0418416.1 hypothetical protein [Xanthomonas sacchari]UYK72521.1 hypothetical protein NG828_20430 [Xanthomonas sacchari]